jgi:hypothetical protein
VGSGEWGVRREDDRRAIEIFEGEGMARMGMQDARLIRIDPIPSFFHFRVSRDSVDVM